MPRELRGRTVKYAVALFAVLMAVWLLNSGHYTPLLIGFGVASCLFVVYLSWRMRIVDDEAVPYRLIPRAILYAPWLLKEVFKANVDVAKRILTPGRLNISPKFFHAESTQKSDLGRVLYANSITLTPGTVSIMVHGRTIWVHAIAEDVADGLMEGEMDRRVTRLEGLDTP
jgi:multicomponent Na+:H+ antiporter subunit E